MLATRSRREERKEQTRAELIAAAALLRPPRLPWHFARADRAPAGCSAGAIYWHFSGKDDFLLAVYETYATTRAREIDEGHEHAVLDGANWLRRGLRMAEFVPVAEQLGGTPERG